MKIIEIILLAFKSSRDNIGRTVLTCLIIAFGIMALVGILTVLEGITVYLNKDFSSMGANTFKVKNRSYDFTLDDEEDPAEVWSNINFREAMDFKDRYPLEIPVSVQRICNFSSQISYNGTKSHPNIWIIATDEAYIETEGYEIRYGRNFNMHDLEEGLYNVILGNEAAGTIFDNIAEGVGQLIRLDGKRYRVIGVLEEKGTSLLQSDKFVLIPARNAQVNYSISEESYIISVRSRNPAEFEMAKEEASGTMRLARRLASKEKDTFAIVQSNSILEMLNELSGKVKLGGFIFSIVILLGAAIGLMNIMLVSVTERTKEIGVLKSIGATSNMVLLQFLLEAVIICQLGGVFGIILGAVFGNIVSVYAIKASFTIPWLWILAGFVFCFVVGMVSGMYPAIKASRQNAIDALRYE